MNGHVISIIDEPRVLEKWKNLISYTPMEEFIAILEETPWWVFVIFFYLVVIGVKALQPSTVSIYRLVIFPVILTVWGLVGIQWRLSPLLAWGLAVAVGFGLGWLFVRKWKIRYDRRRGTLHLPGTCTTLVFALLFFGIKYFFGFYNATHAEIPLEWRIGESAAAGVITGMFIGRLAFFWKRYEEI
jgi:hypothetical protein